MYGEGGGGGGWREGGEEGGILSVQALFHLTKTDEHCSYKRMRLPLV